MSAAMMDRFKVSSLGTRPRVPDSRCERKCSNEAHRSPTAPRGIPTIGRGRSPGLWDRCVSPSRELALTVAEPRVGRKAPDLRLLVDTPAPLTVAGAAEDLEGFGIPDSGRGEPLMNPRSESASAPLSRFTPARGTCRDTSNERVDCTTQVAGLHLAAASGIYIENESLHLDLTGFSKL